MFLKGFMKKLKEYPKDSPKIIIFDFDGVLADTIKIKGNVFSEVFKDYGFKVKNFANKFHLKNIGLNRKKKFIKISEYIGKYNIKENELRRLNKEFNIIYSKFYKKIKLNLDFINYIKKNKKYYKFYISSTAPKKEIKSILEFNKCNKLFIAIYGSEISKVSAVNQILKKNNAKKSNIVFIGDSILDFITAKKTNINFISYRLKSKGYKKNVFLSSSKKFNKVINEYFSNN